MILVLIFVLVRGLISSCSTHPHQIIVHTTNTSMNSALVLLLLYHCLLLMSMKFHHLLLKVTRRAGFRKYIRLLEKIGNSKIVETTFI
jgi:hypothetical protein